KINTPINTGAAPLRNISVLEELLERLKNRDSHLPGIGTFSGPSGFGKSTAVGYVNAQHHGIYIEVRSVWTKKAFLAAILKQQGIAAAATIAAMADQVSEDLAVSQRPLLLDEADNLVARGLIEVVRDIYEQSRTAVVLIGEEQLPQKLRPFERFHGRVLDWAQALPADADDVRSLVDHYAPQLTLDDALVNRLVKEAAGSVRRIVTNLDRIAYEAKAEGWTTVTSKDWGNRPLQSANPPAVRRF
ncbi:MAG: ATP-binding protein, partial [Alphaproteobacteria bacterium]|nr:ATP-binding protein [Alphaproteobacteria bacterium]